jgi:hypothetical protein
MAEFVSIDLNNFYQPATYRIKDEPRTNMPLLQIHFSKSEVTLEQHYAHRKPKSFHLSVEEMEALVGGWLEYQARVSGHAEQQEQAKEQALAEARVLLATHQSFSEESLNMTLREIHDGTWNLGVPAFGKIRTYIPIEELPAAVREMQVEMRAAVEHAEQQLYGGGWSDLVASYREVFPRAECQICQEQHDQRDLQTKQYLGMRPLLCKACAEAYAEKHLHPADFANSALYPGAEQLTGFKNYLNQKYGLLVQEEEPAEITSAHKLLTEAGCTGWILHPAPLALGKNLWNFAHGEKSLFVGKPAEDALELISQHITETLLEEGKSDQEIADFWAKHRGEEPSEQALLEEPSLPDELKHE